MEVSHFHDMKVVGPGLWMMIHDSSLFVSTAKRREHFEMTIGMLDGSIRCKTCRDHFQKFRRDHPPSRYRDVDRKGVSVGYFRWTWELHDGVNARLGKYRPSLKEAMEYFSREDDVCTDCGGDGEEIDVPEILKLYNKGLVSAKIF